MRGEGTRVGGMVSFERMTAAMDASVMIACLYVLLFIVVSSLSLLSFHSLFSTLRDSVHLYMAIAPVYRGPDMESIIHLSFMFYNDCTFISKHLTRLHSYMKMDQLQASVVAPPAAIKTEESKKSVVPTSSATLMLVDLAAPLRHLGAKYFLLHLTRQRNYLTELLDSLQSLADLEEDQVYAAANQALKQTLHQLASIEKIWHQLMGTSQTLLTQTPRDATSTVPARPNGWALNIGMLLEYLSSRLVGIVLEKADISVEGGENGNTHSGIRLLV
jgi:hypothetical protein